MKNNLKNKNNDKKRIISLSIAYEEDIMLARQKARKIAELLGFNPIDQTKIATAVSEITRNVIQYAKAGTAEFYIIRQNQQMVFAIEIKDQGPGIFRIPEHSKLTSISKGIKKGLGIGIKGSKSIMDFFNIDSTPGIPTVVRMGKKVPSGIQLTEKDLDKIIEKVNFSRPQTAYEEVLHQNQELLRVLSDAEQKKNQLEKLTYELDKKNRGIISLYQELEDRVFQLKELNELKSKFLSFVSHDLRTPLSAIISLSSILLHEYSGKLTEEQKKQIKFIQSSARTIQEMVDNLLDLGKIENRKLLINPTKTTVCEILEELRSVVIPALKKENNVKILIIDPAEDISMYTDKNRVEQVLRNLIENGFKYTDKGKVELSSSYNKDKKIVKFYVKDTGKGIPDDIKKTIFDEYMTSGEKNNHGTGLGLSIARYIAKLLGGDVELVKTEPEKGSVFLFWIPQLYN